MPTTTLMAPSSWLLDPRGSPPLHGPRSLISDLRSLAVGSQSPLADMERGPATTLIGPLPPGRAPVSPLESPHSGLLQLSISGRGSLAHPRRLSGHFQERLFDEEADHAFAPEVGEVRVVEWLGGTGGQLGGVFDHFGGQRLAGQELACGRRLHRA